MKSLKVIVFGSLFLYVQMSGWSQTIEEAPLPSDASRFSHFPSGANARISASDFLDTLELPFFEDFTQVSAPVDTIFTLSGSPIEIKTLGHHGLKNKNKIYLKILASANYPKPGGISGIYYAKVLNKSTFQLAADESLSSTIISDGSTILSELTTWSRPGAKIGPDPDSLKWQKGGGVYVNKTFAADPPSLYTATFDGLDAAGNPYAYNSGSNGAPTDFLVSQPINLAGLTVENNVVLSFYTQGQVFGIFSSTRDSLFLQFKNRNGVWTTVWGIKGGAYEFRKDTVTLKEAMYFHETFQFRFQRLGYNGGTGNPIQLDYIYMDKEWSREKSSPKDAAISKSQSSLLKTYTSMPNDQYTPDELATSVNFGVRNNGVQETGVAFSYTLQYQDGSYADEKPRVSVGFLPKQQSLTASWPVTSDLFKINKDSTIIKQIVQTFTGDKKENGYRYNINNTDSTETRLSNYFSYDDGSAESVAYLNNTSTIIFKFTLNKVPDTLSHIDLATPKHSEWNNPNYRSITFVIADQNKNYLTGTDKSVNLESTGRDTYTRYPLKPGGVIINSKEFYVGMRQSLANPANILYGYDRNNASRPGTVYTYNSIYKEWNEKKLLGSIMIRPVFGTPLPIVGTEHKAYNTLSCEIYPNPTKGTIYIEGKVGLARIYDISGHLVREAAFDPTVINNMMDASELLNGLYFIHLENDHQKAVKKLVIYK